MFEIGTTLREARMRRRIDLVEAEQDTKIRSKYLAALEQEAFDVLPGPVFTRGFLRTYTRYLGLEPQMYIDEYNARFGRFEEFDDQPVLGRGALRDGGRRRAAMRTGIIVCLLVLALVTWMGLRSTRGGEDSSPSTPTSGAPVGSDDDAASLTGRRGVVEPAQTAIEARRSARPRSGGTVQPTARRLGIEASDGATWVEVRRADSEGTILWSGEIAAGTTRWFAQPRIHVVVGMPANTIFHRGSDEVRGAGADRAEYIVSGASVTLA